MDEGDAQAVVEFSVANGEKDTILFGILDGLSAVSGVDPLDMDPIESYVDTDALSTVISSHTSNGGSEGDLTVQLSIDNYEVTIESYGRIRVSERGSETDPATD